MFFNNIDHRNLVSIVLGLIIAALLRKYLLNTVIDLDNLDKNFINELIETILDVLTSVVMMLTVYYLYPIFKKNKA
jgi:hypothetical protein